MVLSTMPILAEEDFKLSNLLYLLLVVVLPLLSSLGAKLRKKFEKNPDDGTKIGKRVEPPRRAERVEKPSRRGRAQPDMGKAWSPPPGPARPVKVPPQAVPMPPRAVPVDIPAMRRHRPDVVKPAVPRGARRPAARRPVTVQRKAAPPQAPKARAPTVWAPSTVKRPEPTIAPKPVLPRALLPYKIDAASLRAAVILSEILRPPVALREELRGGSQP